MAAIATNDDFRNACEYLIQHAGLVVQGERVIIAGERKVFDRRGAGIENLFDITPDTATLETALDNANAGIADENTVATTASVAKTARRYLRDQLRSASPNVTTIFNTVKAFVDDNPTLSQMVTNQQALMSNSFTWILNLVTPTAVDRQRYLLIVEAILPLLED